MRGRGAEQHAEAVARRLELLRAELSGSARPVDLPVELSRDEDEHTRIRPFAPIPALPVVGEPAQAAPPSTSALAPPVIPAPGRHASRRRSVLLSELRGKVALGTPQLGIAAALAALGLAITAWWVLGSGSDEAPVPPSTAASPLATVSTAPAGPTPPVAPDATDVVIDVAGKVRRPGIVVLPTGSRVVDALAEAGGARRGVDLTALNLARVLVDGEQIVVGGAPPSGIAASAAPEGSGSVGPLINLNTATLAQLDDLPGVGPVTAQAIIDWREANGGFRAVDQLLEVDGIGEKTLADLAPHVTL